MDIAQKIVPPTRFLSATRRLKIPDIPAFALEAVGPLYAKLEQLGLKPAGDLVFAYRCHGESLDCRIGIPVQESNGDAAPFQFTETDEFRCASTIYAGSMKGIGKGWDDFYGELKAKEVATAAESREVYVHWVDFDSPENKTELQVGIQ